jgi:DNA primase
VGIVDEDIDRVKAASALDVVVGEHVSLRRVGARWVGLCPFHAEKSPSFNVNAELGFYKCFGCGASGDAISFVREVNQLDFVGAVELLAGRAGISLRYDTTNETGERRRRRDLVEAMGKAVEWYHQRLLTGPDAGHARGYLRERGFDGAAVRQYKLGWAPDGWDELCRSLKVGDEVLRDTGLGFLNKRNKMQDSFRARVLFPIFDARGDAVALGGRVLPGAEGPKYKNSTTTPIYDKSEVLYGLNWAKADIVTSGAVVICEGYTDVIGFARAGVPTAVATCGTALTERHVMALRKYARRIVLAFDADPAGQGAAEKFYEWERKHDLDVVVAALPAGVDPGELATRDPEGLRKAVEGSMPFLEFRLDRLLQAADLGTVEGRARAADMAMPIIAEHPNELVRDQYVMWVADRCRLEPDRVRAGAGRQRSRSTAPAAPRQTERRESAATLALCMAVQTPDAIAGLLHEVLFVDDVHRAAFRAIAGASSPEAALAAAEPDAAELLSRLVVEDISDLEPDDVVAMLVAEVSGRALKELESEARVADDWLAYQPTFRWLVDRRMELREPETRSVAVESLVPFLVARAEESWGQ